MFSSRDGGTSQKAGLVLNDSNSLDVDQSNEFDFHNRELILDGSTSTKYDEFGEVLRRGPDSLGNNTKFASARAPDAFSSSVSGEPVIVRRYRLQAVSRRLLPAERVRFCCRSRVPDTQNVEIWKSREHGKAHYKNLMRCGSVWNCPVCSAKITERRRVELQTLIEAAAAKGCGVALTTWTLRHTEQDALPDLTEALITAFKQAKEGRVWVSIKNQYGYIGIVRALEVTWGAGSGWHPHLHVLMVLDHEMSEVDRAGFTAALRSQWEIVLARQGYDASWEHGVDVQLGWDWVADYVAKWGHDPSEQTLEKHHGAFSAEITKQPVKQGRQGRRGPFQLLASFASGDVLAGSKFVEFAAAFKGKQQIRYSPKLREYFGLGKAATDEQLVEESQDNCDLMAELSPAQWDIVILAGMQGRLLEVASTGNRGDLYDFLDELPGMSQQSPHYLQGPRSFLRAGTRVGVWTEGIDTPAAANFWLNGEVLEAAVEQVYVEITALSGARYRLWVPMDRIDVRGGD